MEGLLLFVLALLLLFVGYSIAFTFAGVSVIVGVLVLGPELFELMPYRIMSIMENTIMMAIPMFIFMGILLQRTGIAERLLETMGQLFGSLSGGIAISTILVGALLAASTGVVGASVVAMGVISLPVMMKHNYSATLATGTICASGTLGQIIPPSIVLIILGDVIGISVGNLFKAALIPGLILVFMYILYIVIMGKINPDNCPAIASSEPTKQLLKRAVKDILPALILIIAVLGSIFAGIATPTESAAVGAVGAVILSISYGGFAVGKVMDASMETVKTTSMVFAILIGATAFSMVFSYSGADYLVEDFVLRLPGEKWTFIILAMIAILVLGFFIDFIEIAFIVVPILTPIALLLNIDMIWFAVLIALNLQTSFLTPPFGFSLFYLRGVAPDSIDTRQIYRGSIPFIGMQILVLVIIMLYPNLLHLI